MMPTKFFTPWAEVDPALKHGGIPGELEPFFVGPDLGDNTSTLNGDILNVFRELNMVAQSISMAPESMSEAQVGRRIVEEALNGVNAVFEKIVDVTHTDATRHFEWCHAIPPRQMFPLAPIRYPLRNAFAQDFVHYCIGTLVEVAELNRNALHSGLDPQGADKLIAPLYNWKATVMKTLFDLEVAGEISRDELADLFSGKYRPGPVVSIPDSSREQPDQAAVMEALSGTDVLQWAPDSGSWAVFADLNAKRYIPERTLQPEGAFPTTEDVAYEQRVTSDGTAVVGSGNTQP